MVESPVRLDVAAISQRRRIVNAMIACCAERTYAATKISDIVALAGVSRTTFYKNFEDKRRCFDASLEACVELLEETAREHYDPEAPPAEAVRKATVAILDLLARKPTLAKMTLREAITVDPAVVLRYRSLVLPALEAPWRAAGEPPAQVSDPRVAFGRLQVLIFDQLALDRAKQLPELLPEIVYAALLPFAGHAESLRQARIAAAELDKQDEGTAGGGKGKDGKEARDGRRDTG